MTAATAAALTALAIWAGLLALRGGFWRADQRLPTRPPPPDAWPEVVAVIPARDEAETIARVIAGHRATAYPGAFRVMLVDDGSGDGTGDLARQAAAGPGVPVQVIESRPLPPGWSGKLWALAQGVEAARRAAPDARYLLLTDADILHAPGTLARLVALAEGRGLAMASLMARLDDRGLWGGLLIPAFVFFFQKLYPFALVNRPNTRTAGAAGGCVLIRAAALEEIGGIASIRGALIDDCTLAARIKRGPPARAVWLGLAGGEVISLRDNRRFGSIWTMVRRTAFAQLRHSAVLLAGSLWGMALTYLTGPLLVLTAPLHGDSAAALAGGAAWCAMVAAYAPTLRHFGRPAWQGLALPLTAAIYSAMTLASALAHWRGRGGAWKGRVYGRG